MKSNFQPSMRQATRAWAAPIPIFCLSLALFGGLTSCKKEPEKATVLAQVGNSTLTLEELRESFPADFEQLIRREQYLDFIKRWMDDEVVYQQALKAKVENEPDVRRKLDKLRRKLLIEEFLSKENASEVFEPDEMAMNQYYEMHKEDFRRKVPEIKFMHIRLQTSKQAAELRSKANRGDFLAVAAANSLDPVPESYASIAFKKQTEFPPCLSQDIAGAGIGAVTLPIACPDGFYLVKVLERQDAGSLIPFPEAKEEISGILVMERKDKLLESRIAKYKEGISVSYNLDQIPGLAETAKGPDAPQPATSAPAGQTTAPVPVTKAAVPLAKHEPRLPREPAPAPAPSQAAVPSSNSPTANVPAAATSAAAPPSGEPSGPINKKPYPRRHARRPVTDSSDAHPPAPKPAGETSPESLNMTPDAEENSHAQSPHETP